MMRRGTTLALAAVTIAVGLLVHFHGGFLGPTARDMLGDALWAMMIFWLISAIAGSTRLATRAAVAYGLCVLVELSQLLHSPALDTLRATLLGHLVFGSGFDPRDLISYGLGIGGAVAIEKGLARA